MNNNNEFLGKKMKKNFCSKLFELAQHHPHSSRECKKYPGITTVCSLLCSATWARNRHKKDDFVLIEINTIFCCKCFSLCRNYLNSHWLSRIIQLLCSTWLMVMNHPMRWTQPFNPESCHGRAALLYLQGFTKMVAAILHPSYGKALVWLYLLCLFWRLMPVVRPRHSG